MRIPLLELIQKLSADEMTQYIAELRRRAEASATAEGRKDPFRGVHVMFLPDYSYQIHHRQTLVSMAAELHLPYMPIMCALSWLDNELFTKRESERHPEHYKTGPPLVGF